MSLSDWAAIGNIASGIAVLISLIYLALQIRQNTHALKRAEANATQDQFSSWRVTLATDKELITIWTKGTRNEELSDIEERRFLLVLQDFIFNMFQIWDRESRDLAPTGSWNGMSQRVAGLLTTRYAIPWWARSRNMFEPRYAAAIDAAIAELAPEDVRSPKPLPPNLSL